MVCPGLLFWLGWHYKAASNLLRPQICSPSLMLSEPVLFIPLLPGEGAALCRMQGLQVAVP